MKLSYAKQLMTCKAMAFVTVHSVQNPSSIPKFIDVQNVLLLIQTATKLSERGMYVPRSGTARR